MERLLVSAVSVSNVNIKYMIQKSNFAVNLPLKLLRAIVAYAGTGSRKSLHTLFDTYLDHILTKFEPNRMVRNVQKFEFLDKNPTFKKNIFDKELTPFC